MRRKPIIPIILTVILFISLLTGCQDRDVDYAINDSEGTQSLEWVSRSELAQFEKEGRWIEKIQGETADGSPAEIQINARILLPEKDRMEVVEIKRIQLDAEYKVTEISGINGIELSQRVKDGYVFHYGQEWETWTSDGEPQVSEIRVSINDTGIINMVIENPMELVSVTEDVDLLSLESVQRIMRNELMEHTQDYLNYLVETEECEEIMLNYMYMELMFFWMEDTNNKGFYSFIPVWKLSGPEMESDWKPVWINAIDGSVINLEDETA